MDKKSWFIGFIGFFVAMLVSGQFLASIILEWWVFTFPAGVFAYGLTFYATDVLNEIWGKETAQEVVKIGFILQVPVLIMAYLGGFVNVVRIIIASLVAYLFSQFLDVSIFHKIRKRTKGKHLWFRNIGSTVTSQFVDTVIFITIAFYGVIPTIPLLSMIVFQYIVKVGVAGLDTPFVYLARRLIK